MNLFVLGWNVTPADRERAIAALRAMHDTFPLLDPATTSEWRSAHGFAAWMHSPPEAMAPRRYAHASDDVLVMYDGTVVAPGGELIAHDAEALAAHWQDLPEGLEGHFVVVRLDRADDTLELANDAMGAHTTYVCRRGDASWVSNSVRLLAASAGAATIDLEAVARCVAAHVPGGDRTFVEGITKLPPAQRWSWSGPEGPRMTAYWSVADLATQRKRPFDERAAARLAEQMTAPLRELANSFAPLECPITAGRDSRVLTALTMAGGLPTEYFSVGSEDDTDAEHGTAIAARFGLRHRRRDWPGEPMLTAWDELSRRIIQANDGMVTLMHAQNALDVPKHLDRIPVPLYGGGGERARGMRLRSGYVFRPSVDRAIALLQKGGLPQLAFVREDARGPLLEHIEATCRRLHDLGFAAVDLLDAFGLAEYDVRWVATESRQLADHKDVVAPYLSRAFMRAVFGTPAGQRVVERIPYMLLEHLSPELRRMPTGSPWPARSVAATLIGGFTSKAWKKAKRVAGLGPRPKPGARDRARFNVLLAVLPRWRERFLDVSTSPLWQVIDRERFEHLTSERAPSAERLQHLTALYQVGTVFEYEADFATWMERWRR